MINMKKIFAVLLAAMAVYMGIGSGFICEADEPVYRNYTVIVASGDTMWDIAGRCTGAKEDIREVIFRIKQENGLKTSHVYPGQVLKIPLRAEHYEAALASR